MRVDGAVVLLQLDHFQVGKIDLQRFQVFDGGAAPGIDRLVVVAHRGEHRLLADAGHQQLHQFVLAGVGVLVFVDQQVAQAALPFVAHVFVVAEQLHRQADQVVEIDRLVGRQRGHVAAVDARRLRLVFVHRVLERGVGVDQAVLPQRHRILDAADQLLVGGRGQVLHQREAVVAVHDREAVLQAQVFRFLAQDLHAQRVEGGNRQLLGLLRLLQQLGDALLHLDRGLVGEGQRGDVGVVAAVLDQVRDLLRDHAGLAGAGAGQHQAGAVQVLHGFALRRIQTRLGRR